ncbi:Glyoxalase/bleomycin resistance protein/dioxygenase [Leadbetterella byssophila DSM 17132]|uniref:Glyoxalase/bleomycin resistance protein/dioxygenase n=1 Tax=Leadbetterella byssophila (strain DSM 17132 / JCM 16389 / KACC 11308 / NBRC 106382 / 4M15) TaxID=649349 RepID=E4RUI6_LEAB4|nr:VOC family protein [Leadbetterella byssophila]ADQ17877.1 Glyoxalase/bleomycin resistance protein/dioxygenase [Leadbetterella byssophila DSM 17132]
MKSKLALLVLPFLSACSPKNYQQVRIARPTNQLAEIKHFYGTVLGLPIIGSFEGHEGYDGLMFGLPNKRFHLEFTSQTPKPELPAPTKENLTVLYYPNEKEYTKALNRILSYGYHPVEPENPYWLNKSQTFEDPDGWRVVLFRGKF